MNKRALTKKLVELLPDARAFSNYILRQGPHTLEGYALDITPGWIYVWKCTIPLYDNVPFLHLTFSHRVGDPVKLDSANGARSAISNEVAEHVIKTVMDKSRGDKFKSLEEILSITNDSDRYDFYIRKLRAFTLLHLGNPKEAELDLMPVAEALYNNPSQAALAGADTIMEIISRDPIAARMKILEWEEIMKLRFLTGDL